MKKKIAVIFMALCCLGLPAALRAQSAEVQQLLLDVTKLDQFRQLLKDLQKSYTILNSGYSTIKNIASGNFNLHAAFIDGLLKVSPALARYRRVADIIRDEKYIITQYKTAFSRFKSSGWFDKGELAYMGKVYTNLAGKSVDNLEALTTVLTAGKLRMTDDERLREINRLYKDTHRMRGILLHFNEKAGLLAGARKGDALNLAGLKEILRRTD